MSDRLKVVEFIPQKNHDAIELTETVLEKLKDGTTVAVGLVIVHRDRGVATAYSKSENYHELLSGAARLMSRLANEPGEEPG